MNVLGSGLSSARHYEDALTVREAQWSVMKRIDDSEYNVLVAQNNLAGTYYDLGRFEEASQMYREVYSRRVRLNGEEHGKTVLAANNYAATLMKLTRLEEAKTLLRKMMPVARRVLGDCDRLTLKMRKIYARALWQDDGATLDDIREAVTTLEEIEPIARRVLGGAHPTTGGIEVALRNARAALRARETPSGGA